MVMEEAEKVLKIGQLRYSPLDKMMMKQSNAFDSSNDMLTLKCTRKFEPLALQAVHQQKNKH
jgi:hypothetical protein